MSILIKGMDMPNDCCQCKLARYDDYENDTFCPFTDVMCLSIGRQDNCPLEGYPSAQPEPKWIPCSERLLDKEVLCCDTRGEMIIGYPYQDDEESNTGFSAESDDVFMIDCVAWMPLPEPYRAERRTDED